MSEFTELARCGNCIHYRNNLCHFSANSRKVTPTQYCANFVENPNKKKRKLNLDFQMFTDLLQMADRFLEIQPLFYDRNKNWFRWDFDTFSWKLTDEVDILNALDRNMRMPGMTVKTNHKNEIIEALRRRARLSAPEEPKKSWIQFHDTIVDLKSDVMQKASPEFFFTCPIPHKLGATEDTPIMDQFFRDWVIGGVQDESYVDTLYEAIAYSCLKHQFLQRMFAYTGTGSNGKGVFLSIIRKFLGFDNVTSTELKVLATNNFEAAALYRKQAVFMGEVDIKDLSNTNLIKKLCGEDLIRYEFKGKTPFSEESFCTCHVATNSLPITPDQSDGFYRRWLLVEFPNQFSTGRDILSEIPEEEFQNLARKSIRLCKELYDRRKFTNEGSIIERKQKYEERSNPVAHFIKERFEDAPGEDTFFSDFYQEFILYLKNQRLRDLSRKQVSNLIKREGYVVKTKNYHKDDDSISTANFVFDLKFKE